MKITVLDDYQDAVRTLQCFAKVAGHDVTIWNDRITDQDALATRLKDTEALVLIRERTQIRAPLIAKLDKLKLISQRSVYPHIDVEACIRKGIVVSSDMSPGQPSYAAAELTWALVLAAMRHLPKEVAALKAGRWQSTFGTALRGRTLGVFGYGRIGGVVAGYGKAFGMNVLAWGGAGSLERARADGFEAAASKSDLFERADVLTLHLRLTQDTRGIVARADLDRMKTDSLLVNASRAELVEPGALAAALKAGRPGRAAVDVYEEEPVLGASHPLLELPNALCTPHLGYVERDGYETAFSSIFDQINAYAAGRPVNVVNPQVLKNVSMVPTPE
jgi:D-3-phosphoglycerate dehydrogenase